LKEKDLNGMEDNPISVERLGELIDLVEHGFISALVGKEVLLLMTGGDSRDIVKIVENLDLSQISDFSTLRKLCLQVVEKHSKEVEAYKKGRERVLDFFVGQVMKLSKGKGNPQLASTIIKELLTGSSSVNDSSSKS